MKLSSEDIKALVAEGANMLVETDSPAMKELLREEAEMRELLAQCRDYLRSDQSRSERQHLTRQLNKALG